MKIYLVGGAVRDQLLGYPVYDKDWVVVGATAEQMIAEGFQPVGSDFPVFIHPDTGEEYALARTERKSGKGYTGFQFYSSPDITLEDDLIRRDLTINAMAMDEQGHLFDPYHGAQDLKAKTLRHVSPAFAEDPLRVLRVARFAARYHHLGFTVAPETITLMNTLAKGDELSHLTAERIWKEFERALGEQSPEVFLSVLLACDGLAKIFPALAASINHELLQRFKAVSQRVKNSLERFACLLSLCDTQALDVGKFCDQLRTPKAYKELAQQCSNHHLALAKFDGLDAQKKLQLIQALDLIRRPERIGILTLCTRALIDDELQLSSLKNILDEFTSLSPKALIARGFTGAELGAQIAKERLLICEKYSA